MSVNSHKYILTVLLLLLTTILRAQGDEHGKFIFTVYCQANTSKFLVTQTGFKAKGYNGIITTLHGVLGKDKLYARNENGEYFNLQIGAVDINNDVALLVPNSSYDNSIGLPVNIGNKILAKQELRVIGHPAGINLNIKTVYAGDPPIETLDNLIPPSVSAIFSQRNSPFEQIQIFYLEANLIPGHSGSPLINMNNEVIGVVDGGILNGAAGISWAIPIGKIRFTSFSANQFKINELSKKNSAELFALESAELSESQYSNDTQGIHNKDLPINSASKLYLPGMVLVEGGTFAMGCDKVSDDTRLHSITLGSFYISKYEVSINDYHEFCDSTNRSSPDVGRVVLSRTCPIFNITWYDALAYCNWLSHRTGKKYRLPTEAEWEYAARGGNKSKGYVYSGSNNIKKIGWYEENSRDTYFGNMRVHHPAATKQPNELGLYDLTGNVSEWCSDWYKEDYYFQSASEEPRGPENGLKKVVRGGGAYSTKEECTVCLRSSLKPDELSGSIGFRIACSP